jgi:hypothetical protein
VQHPPPALLDVEQLVEQQGQRGDREDVVQPVPFEGGEEEGGAEGLAGVVEDGDEGEGQAGY